MRLHRQRGFNLIEVVVTAGIIGILASIAYPSYISHIVKSNRAAAQAVLTDIAQKESQYVLDNRAYKAVSSSSDLTSLGVTVPSKVTDLYTISVTVDSSAPPAYTATATPVTGGRQVSDGTLTVNSAGARTPSDKW
jgi:type IV pilus assembly protein PilE